MKKQTKTLVAICCICVSLFASCGDKKASDEIPVIDIGSNVFNMEKIYLSDYASSISYIPMEVDINNYIYEMSGIYADFSDEYIVDSDGVKCLLYDREGHFIRMIGGQGRGPGEYGGISLNGVFLRDGRIYIHDYHTDDLIEYKTDGAFVKRHNSGFTVDEKYRMEDVYLINDSIMIGNLENRTGHEEYKAFLFDKNGSIIESYQNYIFFDLEQGNSSAKSPGSAIYYKFGDNVYFKEYLNDTLFVLNSGNQFVPCYILDFGKYKQPVSERGKSRSQIDLGSYINTEYIFKTQNFLFLKCSYNYKYFPATRLTPIVAITPSGKEVTLWKNSTVILGSYSKETGNFVFSEPTDTDNPLYSSGFYNDIDAGPRFMPQKMVNDSTIAMKIPFNRLMKHIGSNDFMNNIPKYPDQKRKLEMLVDSLKKIDFDNPVYMLVTFKND